MSKLPNTITSNSPNSIKSYIDAATNCLLKEFREFREDYVFGQIEAAKLFENSVAEFRKELQVLNLKFFHSRRRMDSLPNYHHQTTRRPGIFGEK